MTTRNRNKTALSIAVVAMVSVVLTATSANAQITVEGVDSGNFTGSPVTGTCDAFGLDKLVVVLTGEHGFNNDQGNVTSVTYDGVDLVQAINRDAQENGTDTIYNDIWYLDNPATSTGSIVGRVRRFRPASRS